MMILLLTFFLMMFVECKLSGVFLFFIMFGYFFINLDLFGMISVKGDLFGMLGSDYISFYMVLLLLWIVSLVLILFYSSFLFFFMYVLVGGMMFMFVSMNFLYLFIFFEFSMLPMFLIIVFWGSFKERYFAGMYMFIYTVISSLPMLVVLLLLMSSSGSGMSDYMLFMNLYFDFWIKGVIIIMFLVKVPMFLVHIWLPKAHVEAPVFGSMVLASVMLKMGGYGIIRCLDFMVFDNFIGDCFFCFCLSGGVLVSYFCLYQVDLKVLVAYSSIIHMGMVMMGIFSGAELGYKGGIVMMLSHGICSSGMFYLVNEIYSVSGSRLLMLNKGCMGGTPILAWMWLVILINNLGVPPCFGILGELLLLAGCGMYSVFIMFIFFFVIFFTSCFVINMYSMIMGGVFMNQLVNVGVLNYYGFVMHFIPLNFLIYFLGGCL